MQSYFFEVGTGDELAYKMFNEYFDGLFSVLFGRL